MASTNDGVFRLDTALYIGIAVDVVLAIVAGVLIYWWKKRVNDKNTRKFVARYATRQETIRTVAQAEVSGIEDDQGVKPEELRQIHAVLPLQRGTTRSVQSEHKSDSNIDAERLSGNFAFLNRHMSQPVEDLTNVQGNDPSDQGSESPRRSRVTFSDLNDVERNQETNYPGSNDDRVVQNPLSVPVTPHTAATALDENLGAMLGEDIAVTTYYTYSPPSSQLDEEASETLSTGDRPPPVLPIPPPPSSPPPPHIVLTEANQDELETGSERELPFPSPPPPPPPPPCGAGARTIMVSNPLYQTIGDVSSSDKDAEEQDSEAEGNCLPTVNFGQDDVSKLYYTDLDESTDIL